jgi:glycosyltransferase involved in cell wall biosynthesis
MHPPLRVTDLPITEKSGWPWKADGTSSVIRPLGEVVYPRISIVTPSFNQVEFIEETIRSVLLQDYPNLEYIVMDGGSNDGTIEILRKYETNLTYLNIGPDDGQSSAIASGFEHATGDILAWLNSDDIYLPDTLKRIGAYFAAHPQIAFVAGDVSLIDENSHYQGILKAIKSQIFLTKNTGGHGWWQPGCFWTREAYITSGGMDRALRFCMDRDLFVRLCSVGKSTCLHGGPLASFRVHANQKSKTILHVFKQENDLLLARYGNSKLSFLRPALGRLWQAWSMTYLMGRRLTSYIEGLSR